MRDIIEWLMEFESLAGRFYYEASKYYSNEKKLNDFLLQSTQEESHHFQIMEKALKYCHMIKEDPPVFIDDTTKVKMESSISGFLQKIKNRTATIEDLIDCVFEAEYSEFNDIFLYIVDLLKGEIDEFNNLKEDIQNHMHQIQAFLESHPHGRKKVKKFKELGRFFKDNILIVEDNRSISQLLSSILSKVGHTSTAFNGEEALKKISEKNYSVILSDIGMPVMGGIDFYRKASEKYPDIGSKFIFYTASLHEDRVAFFKRNNLRYLEKPSPVKKLKSIVKETIMET